MTTVPYIAATVLACMLAFAATTAYHVRSIDMKFKTCETYTVNNGTLFCITKTGAVEVK